MEMKVQEAVEADLEKKCARGHRYWLGDGTSCDRCFNMDQSEKALAQDKRRVDLLELDIQSRAQQATAHEKLVTDSIENSKAVTELIREQTAQNARIAVALEKIAEKL